MVNLFEVSVLFELASTYNILSDPGIWGPIFGSESLSVCNRPC